MRAAALAMIARDLRRAPSAARGVLTFGSWAVNIESSSAFLRFRKTPARVDQRLARTPKDFKAWSQNLGHVPLVLNGARS